MSLALRHHLSGNPSCPHARKFIRLTDTLASSKRCTYSYGHILQCWGLMEHNLVWVGCNTILLFSSSHPFEVWTVYPSFLVAYDTLTMWLINHFWYVFIRFPPFLFLVIHFVWILFLRFFGRNPLLSFPLFVLCSWFSSVLPIECPYISLSPKLSPALPA